VTSCRYVFDGSAYHQDANLNPPLPTPYLPHAGGRQKVGDIITSVNGVGVISVKQAIRLIRAAQQTVVLEATREIQTEVVNRPTLFTLGLQSSGFNPVCMRAKSLLLLSLSRLHCNVLCKDV